MISIAMVILVARMVKMLTCVTARGGELSERERTQRERVRAVTKPNIAIMTKENTQDLEKMLAEERRNLETTRAALEQDEVELAEDQMVFAR